MTNWDYEVIASCQYEVKGGDCGEPATHRVWWFEGDDYPDKFMDVCPEHFKFIKEKEGEKC